MKLKREFVIKDSSRLQVLSNGGGTQSAAMVVLIAIGCLPKPDLVLMSDTEYESTDALEYQEDHIKPLCKKIGIDFVIVKKSEFTKDDIATANNEDAVLPGFYSEMNGRNKKDRCGKKPSWCSDKWKAVVLQRYLNKRYGEQELTKRGVDWWIGMSLDEPKRIKITGGKWQRKYPLFEARIERGQAIEIVENYGLPTPPRSACWMCPNRHDDEWKNMKENSPLDFNLAVDFEKQLQKKYNWLWLHDSGVPLDKIDFIAESKTSKQGDMFKQYCDSGMCFV